MTDQDTTTPEKPRGWFHRRMMTYMAWAGLALIGLRVGLGPALPEGSGDVLGSIAWVLGLVILTFFGTNNVEALMRLRK